MALWLLTAVLLGVTVVAFFWASGSSKRRTPPSVSERTKRRAEAGGEGDAEVAEEDADVGAPPGAPAEPAPAAAKSSPNMLAWATFAFSAFGTVSTFVLSLLTYLRTG